MKIFLTLCLLLFGNINILKSCTCDFVNFCDYLDEMGSGGVFYGEVINKKVYSQDNHAMYLKVLTKIRGGFITDTVKIYGGEASASCEEGIGAYQIGRGYIFAFDSSLENWNSLIVNPDSLTENYREYKPIICNRSRLSVVDDLVKGVIKEGLFEYPIDLFLTEAKDCDFSLTNVSNLENTRDEVFVYPNPVTETLLIRSHSETFSSASIKIYSLSGALVYQKDHYIINEEELHVDFLQDGLYLIEVDSDKTKFLKKIVVR